MYPYIVNINDLADILSTQREQLTKLKISTLELSLESTTDMERFGDVVYSMRNCEDLRSLEISPIIWKEEDVKHIDSLYKSWLRHGRKRLKHFLMGRFDFGFSVPDELSRKLDEMGLTIYILKLDLRQTLQSSCILSQFSYLLT